MKITVVIDANIILSALLGGKPSSILFDGRFQFVKGTKIVPVPKSKRKIYPAPSFALVRGQKLSENQIKELPKLCLKIEDHYEDPQDVEWALERRKFFIVQSRPITAL